MRKLRVVGPKNNRKLRVRIDRQSAEAGDFRWPDGQPIEGDKLLLSYLLPTAVKEFFRQLESEVTSICGERHSRGADCVRWGAQPGSIYLGGQKVAVTRPRVRRQEARKEQGLETYERFRDPSIFDERVFRDSLRRVSQRDYEGGVEGIGGAFGFKRQTVSTSFKRSSLKQLEELQNRDLSKFNVKAVFIDGKRFQSLGVVVALGIGEDGRKHVLGIFQANTENAAACLELLADLERRGLPQREILFVVDGGSGLNSALEQKYAVHDEKNRTALRIRCYFHKWRNIEEALGKDSPEAVEAGVLFWAIRNAKDLIEARAYAESLEKLLKKANVSALRSFQEAKPDLLILHSLKLSAQLNRFLSTTNPIESLNSLLEEDLRRVKRWRDSEHFQRWLATAALANEKRMRRVRGFKGLDSLSATITKLCASLKRNVDEAKKAA